MSQAATMALDVPAVDDLPAEDAVGTLIDFASRLPASDLFFATNEDHVAVSVRHLGLLRPLTNLPADLGRRCISHTKVMSRMELAERRRPLDGRWLWHSASNALIDLRVSTIPTLHGEDMAVRILMRDAQLLTLDQVGLFRRDLNELVGILNSPSGLILVTGPTGCGKTTTLYACLQHLNNGERKINTIEDPIEFEIAGMRQSQVNLKIEMGFAELLRSVLRQAPDVIMIGEIRDAATATTAVYAASTGHLVLATLHSPTAAGAVERLMRLSIHPHSLSQALLGVVAQRLVRTLCPKCKIAFPMLDAPHIFDEVSDWREPGQDQILYGAKGCSDCYQTGYASRVGVFEFMKVSRPIRQLIDDGCLTKEIHDKAIEEGLIELRRSALLKVAQGDTTAEEVVRAIRSEHLGLEA